MTVVLAMFAGGAGATLRYVVDQVAGPNPWRWSTLGINVAGSFGIGILISAGANSDLALIVGTGFLGGFTTFSTASVIAAQALLERQSPVAVVHTVATAALCVTAAAAGLAIG